MSRPPRHLCMEEAPQRDDPAKRGMTGSSCGQHWAYCVEWAPPARMGPIIVPAAIARRLTPLMWSSSLVASVRGSGLSTPSGESPFAGAMLDDRAERTLNDRQLFARRPGRAGEAGNGRPSATGTELRSGVGIESSPGHSPVRRSRRTRGGHELQPIVLEPERRGRLVRLDVHAGPRPTADLGRQRLERGLFVSQTSYRMSLTSPAEAAKLGVSSFGSAPRRPPGIGRHQ